MSASSDPVVLFVRPKDIRPTDKKTLREAGILVIEVPDPSKVKMTRAHAEIHSSEILRAALKAIKFDNSMSKEVQSHFARQLIEAFLAQSSATENVSA